MASIDINQLTTPLWATASVNNDVLYTVNPYGEQNKGITCNGKSEVQFRKLSVELSISVFLQATYNY